MADRIVVMNEGRIEQIGTPLDLYDNPQNRFVANFIGAPSMELIPGQIVQNENQSNVRLADGTLVPIAQTQGYDGLEVEIGVRPENFDLSQSGNISLSVEVVEPTGPETHIYGTVAGSPIRVALRDRQPVRVGETLSLTAHTDHIMVFEGKSGQRIAG